MKITLTVIGKTEVGYVRQGIDEYVKRLQHYVQFDIRYISDVKGTRNMSEAQQKAAEGRALLATLESSDHVVLLDEHGTERTSMDFSQWLAEQDDLSPRAGAPHLCRATLPRLHHPAPRAVPP